MKFIRKNGRIIPIRDERTQQVKRGGILAATAGAFHGVHREAKALRKEAAVKNVRDLKKFKAHLQEGDILVMGSKPIHSGGVEFGDLADSFGKRGSRVIKKAGKLVGLKPSHVVSSNSTVLSLAGGSSKYHAGLYTGKSRVVHMTTSHGATSEYLKDVLDKQNATIYRPTKSTPGEAASAVKFAKESVKRKVKYQKFGEYVKTPISTMGIPFGKKAAQTFDPMVCHTLPIRGWHKQNFGMRGEYTFAGDFKRAPGLKAIASRNIVKAPLVTAKALVGGAARGLKYGVAGAAAVFAYQKYKERKYR